MNKQTKARLRPYLLPLIFALVGGALGYLYYATIGCVTGSCGITASPLFSTLYGAAFGFLIALLLPQRKRAAETPEALEPDKED